MFKRLRNIRTTDKLIILFCLLVIGAIFSFGAVYFFKPSTPITHRASLNTPQAALKVPANHAVSGDPNQLTIPSLSISLSVIHGSQDSQGAWTLTPKGAQYAIISPKPNNQEGNTLIYGHENKYVFSYLYLLKEGAIADVSTSNGYVFHYSYEGTYAVNPHDLSVFSYKGAPILTLQTCSGAFYQNRQMYQFRYISFSKV